MLARVKLINSLIQEFGFTKYLEIGSRDNKTLEQICVKHKVGVDPEGGYGIPPCTSDEFFEVNRETFDIIFVDGLHERGQVFRDLNNSLACLTLGGVIIVHDCCPKREEHQLERAVASEWCGEVWKAVVNFRTRQDVDVVVCDEDWGLGIILRRPNTQPLELGFLGLTWELYRGCRDKLLRIVDFDEVIPFIKKETIDHFIITRFNSPMYSKVPHLSPEWLRSRLNLLQSTLLPCVQNQTCKRFIWAIIVDERTPNVIVNQLAEHAKIIPQSTGPGWDNWRQVAKVSAEFLSNHTQKGWVASTRVDSDDFVTRTFVEDLHYRFQLQKKWLSFTRGAVFYKGEARNWFHLHNPFQTLVEPRPFVSVYNVGHHQLEQFAPVVGIDKIGWGILVHGTNDTNNPNMFLRRVEGKLGGEHAEQLFGAHVFASSLYE